MRDCGRESERERERRRLVVTAALVGLVATEAPARVVGRREALEPAVQGHLVELVQLQGGKLVVWEVEILREVKVHQAPAQRGERKQRRSLGGWQGGQVERLPVG